MPEWSDVDGSVDFFSNYESVTCLNENVLFDEFFHVRKIIHQNIQDWTSRKLTVFQCWIEIFQQCRESHIKVDNVFEMLEFVLCIPGTTASVERIFSLMNMYWSEEKSCLNEETLKAVLVVKTYFSQTCSEFYDYLMKNQKFLKQFIVLRNIIEVL